MADHFSILDYVVDATYLEYANNVAIYGNYAYVGSRSGSGNAVGKYVTILNISDPTNISIVGNIPTDSACGNVKIIDNYLCCMWYTGRLKIFDLSIDPTNPTLLYTKSSGYELGGLCVFHENGDAHVLTANGLYNIDDDCSLVNSLAISGVRQIIRDHRSEYRKYFYCVCSGLAVGYNTYCNIVKWDYDLNTLTSVYSRYINTDSDGFAIAQGYGENSRYVYTDSWSSDSTIYTIDVQNPETSSWTITSVTGGNGSSQVNVIATDPNHPNILYIGYDSAKKINKYYITSGTTINLAYSITDATKLSNVNTIDIIDGLLYVGNNDHFTIVQDVIADPLPPIKPISTPDVEQNTITFEPGPPNEYFDTDLSNWTNYSYTGNGSTSIVSGKLRINLENEDDYVLSTYKYSISPGDFIINIDIPAYEPNSNSIHTYLYLTEGDFQLPWNENNYVRILYNHEVVSGDYVTSRLRVNGDNQDEIITDAGSRPTKFKVTRIGTVISTYYYINSWVLLDSRDFGNFANTITTVILAVSDYNNNGGYVEFDDLVIISENYYFPNDLFNNLDNWQNYCVNGGTAVISSGKALLDVPNGVDAYARLWYTYGIPYGNFLISVDVSDYTPDDIDNGLGVLTTITSSIPNNYATTKITQDGEDNFDLRFIYDINDAGSVTSSATYLTSMPSKFRLARIGTLIKASYYDGSWYEYGSQDFGSYASEINQYYIKTVDGGPLHGGSVKFDNLALDKGISAYNLYWKKDKVPNCYFDSLNNWEITKYIGTEVCEIRGNELYLEIPAGGSTGVYLIYNYLETLNEDYGVIIDFTSHTPGTYGPTLYFSIFDKNYSDRSVAPNLITLMYFYYNGSHLVASGEKINGSIYSLIGSPPSGITLTNRPTKLKLRREGTILYLSWYEGGVWSSEYSRDWGEYSSLMSKIEIRITDFASNAGNLTVDNLIITPSVKDDYDGVINDIVDLTYDHTSLDPNHVYCYELTAQGSESEPSEETYGIPAPAIPGIPENVDTTAGIEEITILWDDSTGIVDQYNLYYSDEWLYDEDFSNNLSNWTITKIQGSETVEITGGRLRLTNNGNNGSGSDAYYTGYNIPSSGDFELTVDVWHSDNEKSLFAIRSADLSTRVFQIISSSTPSGGNYYTWHTIVGSPSGDGGGSQFTPTGYPSKFKFTRIGTVISLYMYIGSSWQLRHSVDYGAYAYEFATVHLGDREEGSGVDYIEFDNLTYTADVSDIGTKIEDVTSPYNHVSLTPGIRYYYAVTAENESGESEATDPIYDIPIPAAPTGVDATAGVEEITISWNDTTTDIDSYNIYWDTTSGVTIETGNKIEDVTSPYIHSSLIGDQTYYYVVTTVAVDTESSESEEVFETAIPGVLDPPTGIDMTSGEEENVIYFISDPEADETHLYWSTTPGLSVLTGTKISDITSPYRHISLNPSLTYYYIFTSENEYGEGDPSAEYNNSPKPEPPNIIDTTSGIEEIIISWEDSTGADSYNIYWATSPNVDKLDNKITGATSPYRHTSLSPGQEYYYAIASEDEDGESSLSFEFSETADIGIPTNIDATHSGDLEITISWDPVNGATSYNLYWLKVPGVTIDLGNKITGVTSPYTHSGLDVDQMYYYIVTAENALKESVESEEVEAESIDIPSAPAGVSATGAFHTIILDWNTFEHIDSYNIYWDTTSGVNMETGNLIEGVTPPYTHTTPTHLIPYYYVITAVNDVYESDESAMVDAIAYLSDFHSPTQKRAIDGFSFDGHSDILNRFMILTTYNEDLILYPNQSFSLTADSTHEVTIGRGVCIKDNTIVHIQQEYTLDFSNNDYYIDSTGDMEEEGYYYIVLKYNKLPISTAKPSYHIIRNNSLFNTNDYIFLGAARIVYTTEYIIQEVLTRDPENDLSRPTIPTEDWMFIDAGEL